MHWVAIIENDLCINNINFGVKTHLNSQTIIFQDTYNVSFEIGKKYSEFNIGATDAGLCQILNGENMRSTYESTSRMEELWGSLDERQNMNPEMITGSGKIYERTFWLDIGDR